jgi:hypothetical protein
MTVKRAAIALDGTTVASTNTFRPCRCLVQGIDTDGKSHFVGLAAAN